MKTVLVALMLPFSLLQAGSVSGLALPAGVTANALQRDNAGYLYVAGIIAPSQPNSQADTNDIYVAKLSPDGSAVIWSSMLGGSGKDSASALALSASGLIYVTGTTYSTDFPVATSAPQSTFQSSTTQAFVAAFSAGGNLTSATFLGGAGNTKGDDVAVSRAGEVVVTGDAEPGFIPTPGTISFNGYNFTAKLDAALAHLQFATKVGGQHLAVDATGNIYVAGTTFPEAGPMTPGAFQTQVTFGLCGGSLRISQPCEYQYVAKMDATGRKLFYATFIAGSHGAIPSQIIVDAQGNAIVAGSTNSADYPTTGGAFQPVYVANGPPPPQNPVTPFITPPNPTGYITMLNAQGTNLVFSTFLGGSLTDAVFDLKAGTDGYLYIAGFAQSANFPGNHGTPGPCFPAFFFSRLTADGSALSNATVYSPILLCSTCSVTSQTGRLVLDSRNSPIILTGSRVVALVNPSGPTPAIGCVLDAADLQPVTTIAPGQLLSMFSNVPVEFGYAFSTTPVDGLFPTAIDQFAVTMNGVPAPLLYISPDQINLQAPFEISGSAVAQIQARTLAGSQTFSLQAAERSPSLFLRYRPDPRAQPIAVCAYPLLALSVGGQSPLALNDDGSPNTCANPALPGSTVSVYVNGVGISSPAQVTGRVATSPVPLSVPLTDPYSGIQSITTTSVPGSISGLWQVQLQIPVNVGSTVVFALSAGSVPIREQQAVIWTKASPAK